MRNMTEKQVHKMVGTEFIYIFLDGETIPAVIAAFNPKIGFTTLATGVGSRGWKGSPNENGEVCLIGIKLNTSQSRWDMMRKISLRCREIRDTRKYRPAGLTGAASCGF